MARAATNLDMTVGKPIPLVCRFAIPVAIGSVFQALYNTCDTVIVGRFVSSQALAAVGATTTILNFLLMFATQMSGAFSVKLSHFFGAHQEDMIRKTVASSYYICLVSSIIFSLVGLFFAKPLMVLMNADAEILEDSALYLRICLTFCFGQTFYNTVSGILRAVGDSKTPLYLLIISCILNIVMNLLFVVVFHMGVAGVAIATVIAQTLSAICSIVYTHWKYPMFRLHREDWIPDWKLIGDTAVLGASMSINSVSTTAGDVIVSAVTNSYGMVIVAACTAVAQLQRFVTLFFSSLNAGFMVFVGQNYGAGKIERLKKTFTKVLILIAAFSLGSTLFLFLFGKPLLGLFLTATDPNYDAILTAARQYQLINAVFLPSFGIVILYKRTLNGTGDKIFPVVSGAVELAFKLAGALILARFIGIVGVWIGNPVGWFAGIIPLAIQYHSGRWIKQKERLSE